MEVNINRRSRFAEVWMTNADQENKATEAKLNGLLADMKRDKIFVCVYRSGKEDRLENTKAILRLNRS